MLVERLADSIIKQIFSSMEGREGEGVRISGKVPRLSSFVFDRPVGHFDVVLPSSRYPFVRSFERFSH